MNLVKKMMKGVRRRINNFTAYDYSESLNGWKKVGVKPVLGDTSTGTMFDPVVRVVDGHYIMCVSKRKNNSIEFWESLDGKNWKNERCILAGGKDGEWDEAVNRGTFCVHNGIWYLWYTGQSNDRSCIGIAISNDGKCFVKESNAVLKSTFSHEGKSVMNPCVIWDDRRNMFRMWYAAGDTYEPNVICYAESPDGYRWEKQNNNIIMKKNPHKKYKRNRVGGCDIVKVTDALYIMTYIGYENIDVARICCAVSKDGGITWKDCPENPILSPSRGKWDCNSVYKPTICKSLESDKWMLWYNGRSKNQEYIGLAEREGKLDV